MMVLYFLVFLGFNIYYTAFPVFAATALEWSPAELGIYFSVLSALMAFVQGPVLAKLASRYAESVLIVVGGFILGLQFILIVPGNIVLLYLAAVCFAFGNGIMWPCVLSMLSKFAGKTYQGSVQGFAMSASSLGKHTRAPCRRVVIHPAEINDIPGCSCYNLHCCFPLSQAHKN
jgi:DHA1 family tetracycline resistance protein-like MFS transporter